MSVIAETDVVIVGAGPIGLFSVFQLGLFDIKCHLIDSLDRPGGQCAALYADKPIYDVPGFPSILAQDLVDRLMQQIAPFKPQFSFGQQAMELEKSPDGGFRVSTDKGETLQSTIVVIAAGGGAFQPKRSPMHGMTMKLGPVADWGLGLHEETIPVDAEKFETVQPGVFAIGDISWYPGKVRLLLSGFHEAALMTQAARRIVKSTQRQVVQYTSSSSSLQKKLGVID